MGRSVVKKLAQLKIFIPPTCLCFIGYFKTQNEKNECKIENLP